MDEYYFTKGLIFMTSFDYIIQEQEHAPKISMFVSCEPFLINL